MAQIRNYRKGIFETQTLVPIGQATGGNDFIKADGVLTNAFSDLVLYTDAAGTAAVPLTDYSMTTQDTNATAKEAETGTGGSGKVVHAQYQVTNATYQGIDLFATFTNFGTYTDNDAAFSRVSHVTNISTSATFTPGEGFFNEIVIVDTSGGAVTVTTADGKFDGQTVTILCEGSGLSYNLYTGILVSAGTGVPISNGLMLKKTWIDGKWVADNVITADYVSGGDFITQTSGGILKQRQRVSGITSTGASGIYGTTSGLSYKSLTSGVSFPVSYSVVPEKPVGIVINSSDPGRRAIIDSETTTTFSFVIWTPLNGQTVFADILSEGKY